MPASLVVADVSLSFGPSQILSQVSFVIGSDARVGVIGPNGSGKSTLLRVLAGELTADRGVVELSPPQATVGYVAQERERSDEETVEGVLARRTGVGAASAELDLASAALGDASAASADRYATALDRWLALGGGDFDVRVPEVLADVGLAGEMRTRRLAELSGGQLARVGLAAILLGRYDVLLLDEPTNDLDFAGLELLERFVTSRRGAVVVVSHDRAFLERTVTSVVELAEHPHTASVFAGGFASYQAERATRRAHAEEDYELYAAKKGDLEERARRQRQWAAAGRAKAKKRPSDHDVAQRDFRLNRTEKLASKVRISERALDRLEEVEKPFESWQLHLEIAAAPRGSDVVARLDSAVIERGTFRLGPIDFELRYGDRVAITGPNGSGKTTLIEALLGRMALSKGTQHLGKSVVLGELDQLRSVVSTNAPLLDAFRSALGEPRPTAELRSLLAKFGLGADHVARAANTLSPGERTRALLALFMAKGVNLLVLDEPTNHLDLPAIEQLESALESYEGTLILVSHDRRLLESVATKVSIDLEARRS